MTFHTLPHVADCQNAALHSNNVVTKAEGKNNSKQKTHPSLANIPRLISVVEIVKREFLKRQKAGDETKLSQYNELGALEADSTSVSESLPSDEALRLKAVEAALDGKNL